MLLFVLKQKNKKKNLVSAQSPTNVNGIIFVRIIFVRMLNGVKGPSAKQPKEVGFLLKSNVIVF